MAMFLNQLQSVTFKLCTSSLSKPRPFFVLSSHCFVGGSSYEMAWFMLILFWDSHTKYNQWLILRTWMYLYIIDVAHTKYSTTSTGPLLAINLEPEHTALIGVFSILGTFPSTSHPLHKDFLRIPLKKKQHQH